MYIGGQLFYGLTPLDLAIRNKNEEIIEFLEGIGANKSKKQKEPSPNDSIKTDQAHLNQIQRNVIYPEMARRAGVEGSVVVKVLIGKDGRPKPGKFIIEKTPSELLNLGAVNAIMSEVFPPATENGEPIETWLEIPVEFKINRE
jgi:protein TonB